jgi:hypothetical protein
MDRRCHGLRCGFALILRPFSAASRPFDGASVAVKTKYGSATWQLPLTARRTIISPRRFTVGE